MALMRCVGAASGATRHGAGTGGGGTGAGAAARRHRWIGGAEATATAATRMRSNSSGWRVISVTAALTFLFFTAAAAAADGPAAAHDDAADHLARRPLLVGVEPPSSYTDTGSCPSAQTLARRLVLSCFRSVRRSMARPSDSCCYDLIIAMGRMGCWCAVLRTPVVELSPLSNATSIQKIIMKCHVTSVLQQQALQPCTPSPTYGQGRNVAPPQPSVEAVVGSHWTLVTIGGWVLAGVLTLVLVLMVLLAWLRKSAPAGSVGQMDPDVEVFTPTTPAQFVEEIVQGQQQTEESMQGIHQSNEDMQLGEHSQERLLSQAAAAEGTVSEQPIHNEVAKKRVRMPNILFRGPEWAT